MRMKLWLRVAAIISVIVLLTALPLLGACGGGATAPTTTTPTTTTPSTTGESEFDVVKDAVADYLTHMAQHIKASDLHMRIVEGDAPYIASLRSAEDYAKGHVPGAVNIKFSELSTLPKNEEILLYCKSGQDASFGATMLGVLGYDVNNLKHGIAGWVSDPAGDSMF